MGLPILWRGQDVGEVGPIELLPEHVRQEPYSLPQRFQWVTLSSSNVEQVAKLYNKVYNEVEGASNVHFMQKINYILATSGYTGVKFNYTTGV